MPLYEYECTACGHRFETIQKFSNRPLRACPRCKGSVKRLISSAAIQFKGTGWYVTDYARKGEAATAKSDSTGEKEAGKEAAKEVAKESASTSAEKKKPANETSSESSDK